MFSSTNHLHTIAAFADHPPKPRSACIQVHTTDQLVGIGDNFYSYASIDDESDNIFPCTTKDWRGTVSYADLGDGRTFVTWSNTYRTACPQTFDGWHEASIGALLSGAEKILRGYFQEHEHVEEHGQVEEHVEEHIEEHGQVEEHVEEHEYDEGQEHYHTTTDSTLDHGEMDNQEL